MTRNVQGVHEVATVCVICNVQSVQEVATVSDWSHALDVGSVTDTVYPICAILKYYSCQSSKYGSMAVLYPFHVPVYKSQMTGYYHHRYTMDRQFYQKLPGYLILSGV
jgi:hypothetical protein